MFEARLVPAVSTVAELAAYVGEEFRRLQEGLATPQDYAFLRTLHVAPARPREGMLAIADGTNWNPGSGAGLYIFRSGAWALVA